MGLCSWKDFDFSGDCVGGMWKGNGRRRQEDAVNGFPFLFLCNIRKTRGGQCKEIPMGREDCRRADGTVFIPRPTKKDEIMGIFSSSGKLWY